MFSFVLVVAALLSIWHIRGRRWPARIAVAVLLLYCWMPLAVFAARLWEGPVTPPPPDDAGAGALVVLAGAVHDPHLPLRYSHLGGETYERTIFAAELHKQFPALPVLAAGGHPGGDGTPFSEAMRDELIRRGVPAEAIWIETRSRTTYENALYSTEMLKGRGITRILLVTSASHMRRAAAAFRKQGMQVVPAPSAYRSTYTLRLWDVLVPGGGAVDWNDELAHEIIGLGWYWVRGRI